MKRSIFLTALALTPPATALAQDGAVFPPASRPEEAGFSSERLRRIDDLVNDHVAAGRIPGAVVFLARNGKVVVYKAHGARDADTRVPMRRDAEGRFGLDDPIARYIPEFARARVMTSFNAADTTWQSEPAGRVITVRHLLTHASGIDYAAIGSEEFQAIYAKHGVPSGIGNDRHRIAEKMKILCGLPLKHRPGEQFTYSLSMDVLGYFVEVVSGLPFDRFLRERIFEPLGMKDTWFYLPPDRHDRLVTLHDGETGKAVPVRAEAFDGVNPDYPKLNGTYFSGGAGLSGPIEDYARFLQLFLNGGELDGVRLLSPKTIRMMLTDQLPALETEMGLGFGLETTANDHQSPRTVGSFSWGGAFSTSYWADPREGLVALLYTNMFRSPARSLADRFNTLVYAA